jgi:hypothetical protein
VKSSGILNSTEHDICFLIGGYLIKTKKAYNLIDQTWMLDKLNAWFDHKISRSTLCENLKHLVADGMLKRVTRHRRNPETQQFEPRVTLYIMTMKLKCFFLRVAARMRSIGWMNHITAAKRRARAETKRAIEAAREAALPTMSYDQFKASWPVKLGWST